MWEERSLPDTCILAINSIKKRLGIAHLHYSAVFKKEKWKITRKDEGDYLKFKDYFTDFIPEGIKTQVKNLICANWILGIRSNNSFIIRRYKRKLYILTTETKVNYDCQDLPMSVIKMWFQNKWECFLQVVKELIFTHYSSLTEFQDVVKSVIHRLCPEFTWWHVKMYERLYNNLS